MASKDISCPRKLQQLEGDNIEKIKNLITGLYQTWSLIGIDEEQKLSRANTFWDHLYNLGKDIVDEESSFYEDIKERIMNYGKKISDLSLELDLPNLEIKEGTLIEKEEIMRQELDTLLRLKHIRMKEYKDIRTVESNLCKILGIPQLNISSTTGVPSKKDLTELEAHASMMKAEKEKRMKKFCLIKRELTTILEITELTPETSIEKEILSNKEYSSLSQDTFKVLEGLMAKTIKKKADLEAEKKELAERLSVLWNRLNIDKTEREIFLSRHNDICVSNLNAFKQEIVRCDEIKRQNINQYIRSLKEELLMLWENCFIPDAGKQFSYFHTDEASDGILEAFDKETAKWRLYFKDIEHIILKIKKRQNLWNRLEAFENKANDPNRFKNRRGNLLQEERERKQLQKELPNLENEIFNDIAKYETEHEKPFLYLGMDFREYVTKQWGDRITQKENEKIMRQKMRAKQMENEITLGTTPSKKQFLTTPKSAPSKLFKSTLGVPIYRTPNVSSMKSKAPNTISKLKYRNKPVQNNITQHTNILKEKHFNVQARPSKEGTTYDDFATSLNKTSKKHLRSSVLSSRKVVGTRTVSKRKSSNRTVRKSITKKTNTSKMVTPVRGKLQLGIPFLI